MTAYAPDGIIVLGVSGGRQVMTTNPGVDPTAGGGVPAPIGSIYLRDAAGSPLWVKTGAGNTAWYPLSVTPAERIQLKTPMFDGANGAVTLNTSAARAFFLGYAWRDIAAGEFFTARWRVTVGGTGASWHEVAIGKGNLFEGVNPQVAPVGATAVSVGVGFRTVGVAVAGGQSISAGDGLWLLFALNASGSPTLAAATDYDTTESGVQGTTTTALWRPSLNIGTAETFTIDTATLPIKAHVTGPA